MYRRGFPSYACLPSFDSASFPRTLPSQRTMWSCLLQSSMLAELSNLVSVNFSAASLVLRLGNEGLSDLVKPVSTCSLNHASLSKDNLNGLGYVCHFFFTPFLLPLEILLLPCKYLKVKELQSSFHS